LTVEEWLGEDNKIGIDIWNKKYRFGDETFDDWLIRVSGGDVKLKELIKDKKFLFGGRVLANRGTKGTGNFFNCFSRGFVEDDYKDIMKAISDLGLTFKAQGGQGISLTKLRPKGSPIKDAYTSDGIVPFMRMFNEVTSGTSQGGSRKGALMMSIDAKHKEADTFIGIKSEKGAIESANLSLEIDDEFMKAVKKYFETGETITLHQKNEYSGHIVEYDVVPIQVFKHLVDNCYDWGDPACLFVNRFRNYNLMQCDPDYQIETCNPCGEQPLPKHGACCLGSINLSEFVRHPYTASAWFDTEKFVEATKVGIEALDTIIDENANRQPLPEQQQMSRDYRNVGLGVFGYATMLMKLGIKFGSVAALEFTDDIFGLMFRAAVIKSNELSKEFGPFPKYKDCVWDSDIIKEHFESYEIETMRHFGLRNCSLLSVAPSGSISTMVSESGGAEPEFAMRFTRRTVGMTDGKDTYYEVYCKAAKEYMQTRDTTSLPDYFVSSVDIPWKDRVKTQAVMQKHVDTAISSTVNLPNSATKEDIAGIYLMAWEEGLKGITIFRDGCKKTGILTTDKEVKTPSNEAQDKNLRNSSDNPPKTLGRGDIIVVNDNAIGLKRKLQTGCGRLHVAAFFDPITGDLLETFFSKGSTGGCENSLTGLSRMISLAARGGVSLDDIIDQLNSCGVCPSYATRKATKKDTSKGSCCPTAIGYALKEMHEEILNNLEEGCIPQKEELPIEIKKPPTEKNVDDDIDVCPECGAKIAHIGGCVQCTECAWSRCG
jgi:ribonucleoside-diphosphate reductase alpha chain